GRGECRVAALVDTRPWVNHAPSGQRPTCRLVADDEPVAASGEERFKEDDLTEHACSRPRHVSGEQDEAAEPLRRAEGYADTLVIREAVRRGCGDFEQRVEAVGRAGEPLVADHLTALNGGAIGAGEIQRHPLSLAGFDDRLAMDLYTPDAKLLLARQAAQA